MNAQKFTAYHVALASAHVAALIDDDRFRCARRRHCIKRDSPARKWTRRPPLLTLGFSNAQSHSERHLHLVANNQRSASRSASSSAAADSSAAASSSGGGGGGDDGDGDDPDGPSRELIRQSVYLLAGEVRQLKERVTLLESALARARGEGRAGR